MLSVYLSYDEPSGEIRWIKSPGGSCKVGGLAGSLNRKGGYLRLKINGVYHMNHHVALILSGIDIPDGKFVDHINGNRLDNSLSNLRVVDRADNSRNRRVGINSTTGIIGVSVHSDGLYNAYIKVKNKKINLIYTKDKWEAICARMSANNIYGFHENHGR